MSKSYLERAKSWIDAGDDVSVDVLESTILKFNLELKKAASNNSGNYSKSLDLKSTVKYLTSELTMIADAENLPRNTRASITQVSKTESDELNNYIFDSSPLVSDLGVGRIKLSAIEREETLERIKAKLSSS